MRGQLLIIIAVYVAHYFICLTAVVHLAYFAHAGVCFAVFVYLHANAGGEYLGYVR